MKNSSVSICPVPLDQQPIHEYQELADSWFFSWGRQNLSLYIRKIACIWGGSWIIAGPLAAASFAPHKHLLQFMLVAGGGAGILVGLVLLRLYLGWSYVRDRLFRETIVYEESGWYDGQTWEKPPEVLARDRLIISYQIQPILQRLKWTFAVFVLCVFIGSLIWTFF